MFKSIFHRLSGLTLASLAGEFKEEFVRQTSYVNFIRAKIFAAILAVLQVPLIVIDFQNKAKGLWDATPGYRSLHSMHVLIGGVFLLYFLSAHIRRPKQPADITAWHRSLVVAFAGLGLLVSAGVSVVDQMIHGQITVFIIAAFWVAAGLYLGNLSSFVLYAVVTVFFMAGLSRYQQDPAMLLGHFINGSVLSLLAWLLSRSVYAAKAREFVNEKIIHRQNLLVKELEAKQHILEKEKLRDAVEKATRSLQESEAKFRALAETSTAAIVIHQGGKCLYANPAGESISGYTNEEFRNVGFWGLVHPEFRGMVQNWEQAILIGEVSSAPCEFKIRRKNDEERWILMTAGHIEFEGKPAMISTLFDVTERKHLEGKLRYAQKMEAIGKLAGGVAHDFNNMLTAIHGYVNVLLMKMPKDDPLRTYVDQILGSTERATNLTQGLLAFGRKQTVDIRPMDLNEIVRGVERILPGVVPERVRIAVRPGDGVPTVAADSGQVERLIMNFVVNARDAMPDGGTVTIETASSLLDGDFIRAHGYGKIGHYAVLTVSDTGTGMDEQVKSKIFEPFFTTKEVGKGTGLGLSIVYEIVKQHQGYITVESAPGKGTAFRVYLPAVMAAPEHQQPESAVTALQGSETVLVADDEEDVRKYVRSVLERFGYSVLEAVDGEDTVKKITAHRDGVHLLILDSIMPAMSGREAFHAIQGLQPGIKVLFTSGHDENGLRKKKLYEQGQHFIQKPFSPKALLTKVREVLDSQAGEERTG